MINLHNVAKAYGATDVLSSVNLQVSANEKIGLVGANGAGKSTIMKLILGEELPTAGSISVQGEVAMGYVPQYPQMDSSRTIEEYLLGPLFATQQELRRLEELMAEGEDVETTLDQYGKVRDRWDAGDGDLCVATCDATLGRLGLHDMKARDLATLSGGERNLVALAAAALAEPDLLLLDEPGNHLDYQGQQLLEEYLRSYAGAVLIVSHNRYLLDRVVGRIIELDSGSTQGYSGGYSAYRLEKLQSASAQQAGYQADQKKLKRLRSLVERFEQIARSRPDPAWGKRLRARRTQLRMAETSAVEEPELARGQIAVEFSADRVKADIAIDVIGYSRTIGTSELFREASLRISVGERVALIGANGCGKTTFLKDLVGTGDWDNSVIRIGPSQKIGYCAQNQEILTAGEPLIDSLQREFGLTAHRARDVLGRYRFSGEDVRKRTDQLSGGEKNRVQFAFAELSNANLLILDEPTNHMDIPSREVIEDALLEFEGTILLVSHDRYLLEKVARRIVVVDSKEFVSFRGTFSEYALSGDRFWARGSNDRTRKIGRTKGSTAGSVEPSGRQQSSDVEARIMSLEEEKLGLERQIEHAFHAGDHKKSRKLSTRLDRVVRQIDNLYAEWAG